MTRDQVDRLVESSNRVGPGVLHATWSEDLPWKTDKFLELTFVSDGWTCSDIMREEELGEADAVTVVFLIETIRRRSAALTKTRLAGVEIT
jgi:hypothetical protein